MREWTSIEARVQTMIENRFFAILMAKVTEAQFPIETGLSSVLKAWLRIAPAILMAKVMREWTSIEARLSPRGLSPRVQESHLATLVAKLTRAWASIEARVQTMIENRFFAILMAKVTEVQFPIETRLSPRGLSPRVQESHPAILVAKVTEV